MAFVIEENELKVLRRVDLVEVARGLGIGKLVNSKSNKTKIIHEISNHLNDLAQSGGESALRKHTEAIPLLQDVVTFSGATVKTEELESTDSESESESESDTSDTSDDNDDNDDNENEIVFISETPVADETEDSSKEATEEPDEEEEKEEQEEEKEKEEEEEKEEEKEDIKEEEKEEEELIEEESSKPAFFNKINFSHISSCPQIVPFQFSFPYAEVLKETNERVRVFLSQYCVVQWVCFVLELAVLLHAVFPATSLDSLVPLVSTIAKHTASYAIGEYAIPAVVGYYFNFIREDIEECNVDPFIFHSLKIFVAICAYKIESLSLSSHKTCGYNTLFIESGCYQMCILTSIFNIFLILYSF